MATKKELLGNELMKELITIRIDSLWNMIALKLNGRLPPVDAEKATGDFDDKGALFVPGGFVFCDWEENPIHKRPNPATADGFRKAVRKAMQFDGAHLLYPDGIATRVKLGNTAFAKIASALLDSRREALKRRKVLSDRPPARIGSADITRSYCPTWIPAPYGTRTSLSSDISRRPSRSPAATAPCSRSPTWSPATARATATRSSPASRAFQASASSASSRPSPWSRPPTNCCTTWRRAGPSSPMRRSWRATTTIWWWRY